MFGTMIIQLCGKPSCRKKIECEVIQGHFITFSQKKFNKFNEGEELISV